MTPAFDEVALTTYVCRKHPDRLAVEPIAHRRCSACQIDAQRRYADDGIKRDRDWRFTYDSRDDMTPDGRNIRTATANHATHMAKINEEGK